jgi:hypothetical protein
LESKSGVIQDLSAMARFIDAFVHRLCGDLSKFSDEEGHIQKENFLLCCHDLFTLRGIR